jgi:tetratricopeptide (TPR) repeat protein
MARNKNEEISLSELIPFENGFVVLKDKKIVFSDIDGKYSAIRHYNSNIGSILTQITRTPGTKIRPILEDKNSAIVILGDIPHNKKSWIMLASLMKAIDIKKCDDSEKISSLVIYHYNPDKQAKKEIENNSKKIRDKIEHSTKHKLSTSRLNSKVNAKVVAVVFVTLISMGAVAPAVAVETLDTCANFYMQLGLFEIAGECLAIIENIDPNNQEAKNKQVQINHLKAISESDKKLTPFELNDKADSIIEKKAYNQALALYYFAYLKDNESTRALNGIANSLLLINDEEIEKSYNLEEFGLNESNFSKYDIVEQYYKNVIDIFERDGDLSNGVGGAYNGLGNLELQKLPGPNIGLARNYFDLVLSLNAKEKTNLTSNEIPSYVLNAERGAYLGIGRTLISQSLITEGIIQFKLAEEISPNDTVVLNALGSAFYKNGEFKDSSDYYLKSYEIDNDNFDAIIGLALLEAKNGDAIQFNHWILAGQKIEPKIIQELIDEADNLSVLHFEQAESAYRSILLIEPDNVEALLGLGDLLIENDYIDEALILYQKALDLNNQSESRLEKKLDSLRSNNKIEESKKIIELLESFQNSR